jgi:signal peptidase I
MVLCSLKRQAQGDFWLKRIIGLPGDTIVIRGNKVFINNTPLKYEVLKKESLAPPDPDVLGEIIAIEKGFGLSHTVSFSVTENIISNLGPLVVDEEHFFVLGDNRFNSLDSRFLGQVPRQDIFGKYLFRIYKNN